MHKSKIKDDFVLTKKNFLLYASKHYSNDICLDDSEFMEDINRIKWIGKLLSKYINGGELNERLILNHLIILSNIFPPYQLNKMLCLKLEKYMPQLKPFLILLNLCQPYVTSIKEKDYIYDIESVIMDMKVVDKLRKNYNEII